MIDTPDTIMHAANILELAHRKGILRARDLDGMGLYRAGLKELVENGSLIQIARGLYTPAERDAGAHDTLTMVAIKYPKAVFSLLTALQLHNLTTQSPHEVWITVDVKARPPQLNYPPLHIIRTSSVDTLHSESMPIIIDDVVRVLVTNISRTIADCFKYRNKIGLDIAIEALRQAWREKKVTMDDLWHSAEIARLTNVMRPYLESLD